MEPQTNPASRLLNILKHVRSIPQTTVAELWRTEFGLPTKDLMGIYQGLVVMQSLVTDVERCVQRLPGVNHRLFLGGIPRIKNILAIGNLDQNSMVVQQSLDAEMFKELEFCADLLARSDSEEPISRDDLQWIQNEVNELFEEVLKADLPKSLRESILELLEAMRTAIATYRIRGAAAFRKALTISLGELMMQHSEVADSKEKPLVKRVWAMVVRLDGIISKALKYKPLLEVVLPHLLGGPPIT